MLKENEYHIWDYLNRVHLRECHIDGETATLGQLRRLGYKDAETVTIIGYHAAKENFETKTVFRSADGKRLFYLAHNPKSTRCLRKIYLEKED